MSGISEYYLEVWLEAFWLAGIFPMRSELVIYVMKAFGDYNLWLATAMAVLGILTGAVLNWWAGKTLALYRARWFKIKAHTYETLFTAARKYGFLLALFAWTPFGQAILLALGFFQVRLVLLVPVILLGAAVHYALDMGLM